MKSLLTPEQNGVFCDCFARFKLAITFVLKLKCSAFIENWKGRLKNWVLSVRILVPSARDTEQHTVPLDYLKFLKLNNYIGIGLVGLYRWLAHLKFRNAAGRKPSLLRFLHACIIKRLVKRLNHPVMATLIKTARISAENFRFVLYPSCEYTI